MTVIERHSSGGPWEEAFGYSRAVRVGERILVSGCTAVRDGAVEHPGDAAGQARTAFGNALEAVQALGGTAGDVVRTRMYVVDRAHAEAVGLVHGQVFAAAPPAASMVVVAGLISPEMLVEVEVEAVAAETAETAAPEAAAGEGTPA